MLDLFATGAQDLQSPAQGQMAREAQPSAGEAYAAARDANERLDRNGAAFYNQQDYLRSRMDDFTRRTGEQLPALQSDDGDLTPGSYDKAYSGWLGSVRDRMTAVAQARNDPTLMPPSDADIANGGLQLARDALQRQAAISQGPMGPAGMLGAASASAVSSTEQLVDPSNPLNALALGVAPEGGALLASALRMGGAMGIAQLYGDVGRYDYRRQVDPSYGARDVAGDVLGAAAGGALFGAGHVLGGEGLRGTLGAALGGAIGGGVLGGFQGGGPGAIEGAFGGAALPLAGAGFGMTSRALGASWRALVAARPDLAAAMPLDVRDAGTVAEKAGDLDAQNPYAGPSGVAAHGEAIAKVESDLLAGRTPELPPAAQAESQARRGQVFFPGGAIDARYGVAEHGDLITSHDADFNTNPAYPADLQPRDRAGAPARDQVTNMAGNLAPERLGPSPEANSGAPIVGPDGVVESGNGRALAIGRAYDMGRGDAYRQWLEQQGYDTSGFDKPVLVGMRETPLDDAGRAAFAHAANGSASLRMSATEQALSDARLIDGQTLDLHAAPDLAAAANRDFARALVAKLPAGERGGMLTREGGLSAGGAARVRNALTARAYGDPAFLARALDHPDPNIKAIAGALGDAAGPWARMRDAATRGDIEGGHDITRDMLQAVHAIMRARDEGRPAWEVLNQGDIFQSDTTQLAARMFFRDEAMRQAAGRARIAEALTRYAEEAAKNTKAGRLFDDAVGFGDVLRRAVAKVMPDAPEELVLASMRKIEERGDWLGDMMREMVTGAEDKPAPPRLEQSLEDALRELIGGAKPAERSGHTVYKAGTLTIGERPSEAYYTSDAYEGQRFNYSMSFVRNGDRIDAVIHDVLDREQEDQPLGRALTRVEAHKLQREGAAFLPDEVDEQTANARWDSMTPAERQAEEAVQERTRQAAERSHSDDVNGKVDALVASGWRPKVGPQGAWRHLPDPIRFHSPRNIALVEARLRHHGFDIGAAAARARDTGSDVLASIRRTPEELTAATDQAAQDVLAMARRGASTDQLGFDFGAAEPQRNPLVPTSEPEAPAAEPTAASARTPFQSHMHALADTLDDMSKNEAFGETPSGVHQAAYERQRALAGAVKDIAKGIDRVFAEIARVAGDEDVSYDGGVWDNAKDWLHSEIKDAATTMRADMRDPELVGEDADRPHIDLREIAGEIAEEVRKVADTNAWIERAPGEEGALHPDDLDHLADQVAGINARFDQLLDEIDASSQAPWRTGDDGALELRQGERNHVSGAHSLAEDLREAAQAWREAEGGDVAPRLSPAREGDVGAAQQKPDLTLRNPRTGAETQAQDVASLADMLKRHAAGASADPLLRATTLVMGDRLTKTIGNMPVYTVGRAEMRALAEGRMKIRAGMEPGGYFDPRANHIVILDDVLRQPEEAARTLLHEGTHGLLMRTINSSESARNVIDFLRTTATAAHLDRGGEATDHYGLTNVHEFVSEARANPEFQRFLASIPADDRMVKAFGLDAAPGNSLWDLFVAAVRKIIGLAPDQHTLLDATMRVGKLLEQMREAESRGAPDDLAPMLRLADADEQRAAAQEAARKARAFADAKAAIAYRINSDRIAQHPNGPLAGFLGILTRDIHEKGGINVEAVQQAYEGRMAEATEKILEPYGSKWAGLKQDVAGIREMIHELFGVDTKNETAKAAADAWKAGVDGYATTEAKRLGKVFSPAEDWRVPQFWESSRAVKFGRATLLADLDAEVARGGLRVFDPDTGQAANPLRARAILDEAATRITTDASMGSGAGTGSGAFKTDMRVFRFAEGREGADAYLRLMDKYGAGRGGYLRMMEAHVGKVSREMGMMRVLGPDWAKTGAQLLDDTLKADRAQKALRPPRSLAERLRDLPGDAGKLAIGWLESPTKAEAVWHYMSGQSSGVGSELMAGLLSGTRAFMTSTRMGSALVTAVPADTVNWLMAAKHNGMDMGRMVSAVAEAFVRDNPERREEAARLGIVAHAGMDAALGTKRFADQFVGEKLMKRMADFVIRAQGLHAWDSAIKRAFPMEMLGTIAQRAGKAFDELDEPFARFLDRFGFSAEDWAAMSDPANHLEASGSNYLLPDKLPEALRTKLESAIYDERQFAYLAGGSTRVRATSASAKAGTLPGELARSVFLFKSFPMSMLATWGMRAAREAGQGRIGTLAALVTGMTFAGALAMQARALLQGKDPRSMRDPFFWGESFLQGGAAGIYGDFFKEAFSRSDTSLTETMMGPLAAIPAGIQGLTSGARRMAEDGEKVNFGAKLSRIISQNVPGGNLWYSRLLVSRLLFDNIQRMIDRDHDAAFARQQRRAMKTDHQGFFWAPGQDAPGRAPDLGAMVQ